MLSLFILIICIDYTHLGNRRGSFHVDLLFFVLAQLKFSYNYFGPCHNVSSIKQCVEVQRNMLRAYFFFLGFGQYTQLVLFYYTYTWWHTVLYCLNMTQLTAKPIHIRPNNWLGQFVAQTRRNLWIFRRHKYQSQYGFW